MPPAFSSGRGKVGIRSCNERLLQASYASFLDLCRNLLQLRNLSFTPVLAGFPAWRGEFEARLRGLRLKDGKLDIKRAPRPEGLTARTAPPPAATSCATIASPRPRSASRGAGRMRCRELRIRRSKMCGRCCAAIPGPLSRTDRMTVYWCGESGLFRRASRKLRRAAALSGDARKGLRRSSAGSEARASTEFATRLKRMRSRSSEFSPSRPGAGRALDLQADARTGQGPQRPFERVNSEPRSSISGKGRRRTGGMARPSSERRAMRIAGHGAEHSPSWRARRSALPRCPPGGAGPRRSRRNRARARRARPSRSQ